MKYSRTYIKQSNIGVVGHIYEHIVADSVITKLYNKSIFRFLDYELNASTLDGIVVIEIESYNRTILRTISKVLNEVNLTKTNIKNAIGQIESEYKRKSEFDIKKLSDALAAVHQLPWVKSENYPISTPITKEARELKSSVGGFTASAKRAFKTYEIVYDIEDCPYELKTIAVYLLQVLGFIQIDGLIAKFQYSYDDGDEWAEYQDLVGYLHFLTIPAASHVTVEQIEKQFERTIQLLNNDKTFLKRVKKRIDKDMRESQPYFSKASIFAKSYQLVGAKFLRAHTTQENIALLTEKINYSINK